MNVLVQSVYFIRDTMTHLIQGSLLELCYRLRTRWPNLYKVTTIRAGTMGTFLSLTYLISLLIVTLVWSELHRASYHITIRIYCLLCELLDGQLQSKRKLHCGMTFAQSLMKLEYCTVILLGR